MKRRNNICKKSKISRRNKRKHTDGIPVERSEPLATELKGLNDGRDEN